MYEGFFKFVFRFFGFRVSIMLLLQLKDASKAFIFSVGNALFLDMSACARDIQGYQVIAGTSLQQCDLWLTRLFLPARAIVWLSIYAILFLVQRVIT